MTHELQLCCANAAFLTKRKPDFVVKTQEKRNSSGHVILQIGKFSGGRDAGQLNKVQGGCG